MVILSRLIKGNDSTIVAANAMSITGMTYIEKGPWKTPNASKYARITSDKNHPPKNIPSDPSQDFSWLQNSFLWPNRLPMISAIPSPPHKTINATIPIGLSVQKAMVKTTNMRP